MLELQSLMSVQDKQDARLVFILSKKSLKQCLRSYTKKTHIDTVQL